jgi:FkbM family methyltransferase
LQLVRSFRETLLDESRHFIEAWDDLQGDDLQRMELQMGNILSSPWKVLPVGVQSRLIGMRRAMRGTQPSVENSAVGLGTETEKFRAGVPSLPGLLEHLRENGFSPSSILDIGANAGEWSRVAASIFTDSRILMFDGDPENEPALHNTVREIGARSSYILRLLGAEKKSEVTFYRPEAGTTGSSVLPEMTSYDKEAIKLKMDTLDSLTESARLVAPLLMKLDVQGFELEILKGGKKALGASEVVITEASLLPYNEGAPLFADVIALMHQEGFAVYDFCGQNRRESDHALFQTDVVFVRRESSLRARRKFWLQEP